METVDTPRREAAEISVLREAMAGAVVTPEDPDYDDARRVWNMAIDRRPALIARARSVADVVSAIGYARSAGMPVAVRGGSHSIAGFSTCDGGMVIDLGAMRGVHVDPARRVAVVEGGATWWDVDRETQLFGLATPGGLVSSTGVGGFTLGGGIGHLVRKHGLALDNLVGVEVVTTEGRIVRAAADTNADLFWALRGGGGNFGVVTRFEFALHPVGPTVLGGVVFFRGADDEKVIEGWRDAVVDAPEELSSLVNLTSAPPLPVLPEAMHGEKVAAVVACWAGDPQGGEGWMRTLRTLAEPVADLLGPLPYVALQQLVDPLWGRGAANYFTSAFLDEFPDDAAAAYAAAHRRGAAPPATTELHIHQLGGALGAVGRDDTAFAERGARFVINCIARTPTADALPPVRDWARATRDSLAVYGGGAVYVNFTGEGGLAGSAYPPATYRRLAEAKRRWDPGNVFRFNHNIAPA